MQHDTPIHEDPRAATPWLSKPLTMAPAARSLYRPSPVESVARSMPDAAVADDPALQLAIGRQQQFRQITERSNECRELLSHSLAHLAAKIKKDRAELPWIALADAAAGDTGYEGARAALAAIAADEALIPALRTALDTISRVHDISGPVTQRGEQLATAVNECRHRLKLALASHAERSTRRDR